MNALSTGDIVNSISLVARLFTAITTFMILKWSVSAIQFSLSWSFCQRQSFWSILSEMTMLWSNTATVYTFFSYFLLICSDISPSTQTLSPKRVRTDSIEAAFFAFWTANRPKIRPSYHLRLPSLPFSLLTLRRSISLLSLILSALNDCRTISRVSPFLSKSIRGSFEVWTTMTTSFSSSAAMWGLSSCFSPLALKNREVDATPVWQRR